MTKKVKLLVLNVAEVQPEIHLLDTLIASAMVNIVNGDLQIINVFVNQVSTNLNSPLLKDAHQRIVRIVSQQSNRCVIQTSTLIQTFKAV
jgi:hypothetical protein